MFVLGGGERKRTLSVKAVSARGFPFEYLPGIPTALFFIASVWLGVRSVIRYPVWKMGDFSLRKRRHLFVSVVIVGEKTLVIQTLFKRGKGNVHDKSIAISKL